MARLADLYNGLGFKSLLTDGDSNPKTALSNEVSDTFASMLMHLSHGKTSGFGNVCVSASPGCLNGCLDETGHGKMDMVKRVRKARTKLWFTDKPKFFTLLRKELDRFVRKCKKNELVPAVRPNGTSDIIWERVAPWLFTEYSEVQFYDYTKHWQRCMARYKSRLPKNYHLTFSRSEINDAECRKVLRSGVCNVAVVFEKSDYPSTWAGKPTYSMDGDDLRFLDPPGGHVGCLYAKGYAWKADESGFFLPVGGGV